MVGLGGRRYTTHPRASDHINISHVLHMILNLNDGLKVHDLASVSVCTLLCISHN